jgi:hypothetical protein
MWIMQLWVVTEVTAVTEAHAASGRMTSVVLPLVLALVVSSLYSVAFPAHYYAARFHPWVRPSSSRSRSGRRAAYLHVRDVTSTSPEQTLSLLRSAYANEFPLVIRGGAAHWPAAGTWSPKHIAEHTHDRTQVELQTGVQEQEAAPFVSTTLSAFADWLTAQEIGKVGGAQEEREQEDEEREDEEREDGEERGGEGDGDVTAPPTYYWAEEVDWVDNYPGLVAELRLEELESFWQNETSWNDCGTVSSLVTMLVNRLLAPWWERRSKALMEEEQEEDAVLPLGVSRPSEFAQFTSGVETALWMGAGGARTGWHLDHDFPLNLLCHFYGRKRLWIASPDQTPAMYPSNRYDPGAVLSSVNAFAPWGKDAGSVGADAEAKFPLYGSLERDEVELAPGDMLLIPPGWWHAAETWREGGPSVSLSVRSSTPWFWLRSLPDRVLEDMLNRGWWNPGQGHTDISMDKDTYVQKDVL